MRRCSEASRVQCRSRCAWLAAQRRRDARRSALASRPDRRAECQLTVASQFDRGWGLDQMESER
eukprot:3103531-Pleurochrysis_carterae.AAC.1